jgi:hypothetical protein
MVKAMTMIRVMLNDQSLIAAEKVKIASGDIESVFLSAEFDENWTDFTVRTASFYTSHDSNPIEMLLTGNQCTVPAEVLAKPGTLYVGIVGATTDGSAVKTSTITGFKISQGANHAYTTIAPVLSLYQQFLSAVKAEVDPIVKEAKSKLEAEYEAIKAKFLKPCDFSNPIHTIDASGSQWVATQDCWASLYVKGDNSFNATLSIDGVVVVSAEPYTSGSGRNAAFRMSPVYVRSGSTIGLTATSGKDTSVNIYACISE